jgi:phosphoglycolate phosphatase
MTNKIRAVIFDLDGTLLNTIDDIGNAVNTALLEIGVSPYSMAQYKYFVGDGVVELINRVLAPHPNKRHLHGRTLERYLEEYALHQHDLTRPYPGIVSLLEALSLRSISVNVLSNKPHHATLEVIRHFFPNTHFQVVYGKMPEYKPKPDTKALERLIANLGVSKSEVLYVGDTATDMITAKNGGLTAIGCTWGFRLQEELEEAGSDFVVHHPEAILSLIDAIERNND